MFDDILSDIIKSDEDNNNKLFSEEKNVWENPENNDIWKNPINKDNIWINSDIWSN